MTNADRIRQMTDEELEALLNNVMVSYDQAYIWMQGKIIPNIRDWLKQEVETVDRNTGGNHDDAAVGDHTAADKVGG